MTKEIGYSWDFQPPEGETLERIENSLDDAQKRLYETDKGLFLQLNSIKEMTAGISQFSDKTNVTIGEDGKGLSLAVRMSEFSPSFGFTIRGGKIEFTDSEKFTPEKMKYLRAYMEFHGITGFSFPNDFDKEAKEVFEETGRQIEQAVANGDDQWFNNFFNNLWANKPENLPQQPEAPIENPEEVRTLAQPQAPSADSQEPQPEINLGKIYDQMSTLIEQKQGRNFRGANPHATRCVNWFPRELVFEVYKGDMFNEKHKKNKPAIRFKIKEKNFDKCKGLQLSFSSPNNEKMDSSYYGEILAMFGAAGCAPVDISRMTDADKDEFRIASAKKCVMITGDVTINNNHLNKMFQAVCSTECPKTTYEKAQYKLALVSEVERQFKEKGVLNNPKKDATIITRKNIIISAKLDLFEEFYDNHICKDIEKSIEDQDAPTLAGACNAGAKILKYIREGRTINQVELSLKSAQKNWLERANKPSNAGGFHEENSYKDQQEGPYAKVLEVLSSYKEKGQNFYDIPPEELIENFYKPLLEAERMVVEADIINDQLKKRDHIFYHPTSPIHLDDAKEAIIKNEIGLAARELQHELSDLKQQKYGGLNYTNPSIEPFPYDAIAHLPQTPKNPLRKPSREEEDIPEGYEDTTNKPTIRTRVHQGQGGNGG